MLDGFKKFIMRGNVIDLAVGVIIGNAFKPIIDALTDKILLRLISAIFGKPSFNEVGTFHIGTAPIEPGVLITAVGNFLIVAAALYCRRRLAPTRPSVRFVSAAWLRRAIQRLASSAVRPLGGSLPRQSALEGLERCERRARATRNAGVCSPAGGVRRRRGRRRRAVPRASPIGSPSGRRGEEPLPERRSRRGPGARRRGGTA